MPRRSPRQSNSPQKVLQKVRNTYGQSPFQLVGSKLEQLILETQSAVESGRAHQDQSQLVANTVSGIMNLLPTSFGERFLFDTGMIQALTEHWSHGPVQMSGMIVPRPSQTWGHNRVIMPSEDQDNAHVVDVILFPGEDDTDSIDLLSYPWLCHELGHNVLFRYGANFADQFQERLGKVINTLRLRSAADRGFAKEKARTTIEKIQELWEPTLDHKNWSHELAIDMIALWTCGPAYLGVFQDVLDSDEINPYHIDQNHPPYEVRGLALLEASNQLGWNSYSDDLAQLIRDRRTSKWKTERNNQYHALTAFDLANACIETAFQVCETLALPKCTLRQIDTVQDIIEHDDIPDFGLDILLAAWLVHRQGGAESYELWERRAVSCLANSITL